MASTISGGHGASFGVDLKTSQLYNSFFSTGSCRRTTVSRTQAGATRAYAGLTANAKDHYYTLGVNPGASEQDIKKAYRRLALQYHPDVCKGDYCAVKFTQINKAYESVMSIASSFESRMESFSIESCVEGLMGVNDDSWEDWEEWMGWEGAGIRDYSSHVNHAL